MRRRRLFWMTAVRPKNKLIILRRMDGDYTDMGLAVVVGGTVLITSLTVFLVALFPCSCNPRRDCKRNCADCRSDREKCRARCRRGCPRDRADTEEELVGMV